MKSPLSEQNLWNQSDGNREPTIWYSRILGHQKIIKYWNILKPGLLQENNMTRMYQARPELAYALYTSLHA